MPGEATEAAEPWRGSKAEGGSSKSPFVRGGYWRNFKVKYPETNAMYCRMQMVSRRLYKVETSGATGDLIDQARLELYRGQCNCSYWHGAFGGVYLPHLRNAVYQHLIAADNLLSQQELRGWQAGQQPWVELSAGDFNLDGRPEAMLANNRLTALVSPVEGGQIYELDVKPICHNLQASLTRRPEAYHRKVMQGPSSANGEVASIHDQVVFKQEGLDERLGYDHWARNSLVDHFYPADVSLQQVASGPAEQQGDFVHGPYEAKLRRNEGRVQLQLIRTGSVQGREIKVTKGISLNAEEAVLEIAYLVEQIPNDITLHLAPEFNFAGLPSGADDRYFRRADRHAIGQLGSQLDLHETIELGLVDQWLGIDVGLVFDRPTSIWTYPVETVSQSEGGFELVHQSVAVVPHWVLVPDLNGRWSMTMQLSIDTSLAEARMQHTPEVAQV